jgi:FkbM family methyltransferase
VSWRQTTLRAARRVGAEGRLRRVQRAVEPREKKRDRRDGDHLKVLLAATLAPDASCLDIGANIGDVLREIVRCAPEGRHIAYEPLPELAERLAERFPDVDVRCAAVADEPGEATFHRVKGAHSRSSLDTLDYEESRLERLTVPVDKLDDALPDDFAPSLVKIDVEGAEGKVLAGALETLRTHKPVVVVEHGSNARHFGTTTRQVHELLHDGAGLRVFDIDGNGPLDAEQLEAVVQRGHVWTFIARR